MITRIFLGNYQSYIPEMNTMVRVKKKNISRSRLVAHALLVFLWAIPVALWAQLPALPLEEGNFWEYDYVLGEDYTPSALRMQVGTQVKVPELFEDAVFSDKAGWNDLFDEMGDPYFKLAIDGRLPLFGPQSPDTLLVRADGEGNIWIRGFTFQRFDDTVVKAVDQLWLTADIGALYYRVFETTAPQGGGRMAFHGQMKWIGRSADGSAEEATRYLQRFSDNPVDMSVSSFPSQVVAHARRFLPDLSPASQNHLLGFEGDSETTSESFFSFFPLTGIGLVWIPIWSDQTELQGAYYELVRASVGGQLLKADTSTFARSTGWAGIKNQKR
jgi:hypothetical protein